MKYEIAFVSLSGNTEKLANGIADSLPAHNTFVTDLAHEEITKKADVYMICFGVNKGTVPLKVMDVLDELQGKKIMFFVTSGMDPLPEYKEAVEKKLLPFLPDDCDYCGLFMCRGKFSDDILRIARNKLNEEPDNKYAQKILDDAEMSANHPNQTDFENAGRFIRERLGM